MASERIAALPRGTLTWRVRLFPIVFFIGYLTLTVLLFAFGPWPYPVRDGTSLYLFLLLAHVALLAGYLSVAGRQPKGYSGEWTVRRVFWWSLTISLLVLIPTSVLNTGNALPDVISGLADPGIAYSASGDLRRERTEIIAYVRIFAGPFIYMLLPITFFYWKELAPVGRWLAVLAVGFVAATYVAMGTNKAIADTVLLLPWMLLVGHLSGRLKLRWRGALPIAALCVVFLALFGTFFGATTSSRQGSFVRYGYFAHTGSRVDLDHPILRDLPPEVQPSVAGLASYLTQGYYAVYLSLDREFVPMFGVGHSFFLFRQAARITGNEEITAMPYPMRIEADGWDGTGLWSSIYPWLASDLSFPGVIVAVFIIGRFFALSWLDAIRGENPFAVGMFAQFLVMLFYFPGNNQLLQSGEGLTAFWAILVLWLTSRGIVEGRA